MARKFASRARAKCPRDSTDHDAGSGIQAPCEEDRGQTAPYVGVGARNFTASRPKELWVSDFTYVSTWSGFVYAAFVIDAFARRFVGWRVSSSMSEEMVLDALEQAIWARKIDSDRDVELHTSCDSDCVGARGRSRG